MGILGKIGIGIKKAIGAVGRIFRPEPPAAATPEMPKVVQPTITQIPDSQEAEALRTAINMIIEAQQHAGDPTYDKAREEALVYINKANKLTNTGKSQSGNRKFIAKKYLEKEISTPEGVERRKERMLETFNSNFGFDLTRDQAETVGQLMKSDSFKKLMETYKEKYDIIIGMVGDNIELGADPVRIEQQLDLWQRVGMEPDFSMFQNVTALDNDAFASLQEALLTYAEENVNADEFQYKQDVEGIIGRYITW